MKRNMYFEIPFEEPAIGNGSVVGWTLVISRDSKAEKITFALHYGDKAEPTHVTTEELADVREMFEELTGDG